MVRFSLFLVVVILLVVLDVRPLRVLESHGVHPLWVLLVAVAAWLLITAWEKREAKRGRAVKPE